MRNRVQGPGGPSAGPRVVPRAALGLALAAALAAAAALALGWARSPGGGEVRATFSAASALAGGDTAGFARAVAPRDLVFPEDHGAHPRYRTEWWYLTGNLEDEGGRRFGYQLTFFRNALRPEPVGRRSAWDTNQLWMAHFALTDVEGGTHRAAERLGRGAVGIAGAETEPFRVWLEDWELRGEGADGVFPLRLRAREGEWAVDLVLSRGKPLVLQGDRGHSRKGPEPGNASYYYSFTRIPTEGVVEVPEGRHRVRGASWMDREWSTSALGEEHVGWDWFSLQLSDGYDLMFFELRRADGTPDPLNHGVLVRPDGGYRRLSASEVELEPTGRWQSPLDGAAYPSGWVLRIPGEGVELELRPVLEDQEMNLSVRYWEGALDVRGSGVAGPVDGWGFAELTGYGEGTVRARGGDG
jgi:predicted secreted hydrolase